MIKIYKKVKQIDLSSKELYDWLDECFQGKLIFHYDSSEDLEYNRMLENNIYEWGYNYRKNVPQDIKEFFQYTVLNCSNFHYRNLIGRTLFKYVFPEFFKKFSLGQIWLVEVDENWWFTTWKTQRNIAEKNNMRSRVGEFPQEFSGLQEENLINMALDVLSYSLYPLLHCEVVSVNTNLILIFIPDRALQYSQMEEAESLYAHLLWKFIHVFNDQWTFDSTRGLKSKADPTVFNPINLLDYFEWYINLLNKRLEDLVQISDEHIRQQRAMTLNSIICDLFLCISSELPYLSKMSFFNIVDKISNFIHGLGIGSSETTLWKYFLSKEFLSNELINCIKNIPGILGEEMVSTIGWILKQIDLDHINPDLLRDLRNSKHGYLLNQVRWDNLCKHTGEIHNDLVQLAIPLWLYVLITKWS